MCNIKINVFHKHEQVGFSQVFYLCAIRIPSVLNSVTCTIQTFCHRMQLLMAGGQKDHAIVAVLTHVVCTSSFKTSKLNGLVVSCVQLPGKTEFEGDIMLPHRVIADGARLCKRTRTVWYISTYLHHLPLNVSCVDAR